MINQILILMCVLTLFSGLSYQVSENDQVPDDGLYVDVVEALYTDTVKLQPPVIGNDIGNSPGNSPGNSNGSFSNNSTGKFPGSITGDGISIVNENNTGSNISTGDNTENSNNTGNEPGNETANSDTYHQPRDEKKTDGEDRAEKCHLSVICTNITAGVIALSLIITLMLVILLLIFWKRKKREEEENV